MKPDAEYSHFLIGQPPMACKYCKKGQKVSNTVSEPIIIQTEALLEYKQKVQYIDVFAIDKYYYKA